MTPVLLSSHPTINFDSGPISRHSPATLSDTESATVREAMQIIENRRIKTGRFFCNFEQYRDYLAMRFAGLVNEQFHVLYLDTNERLLEAEVHAEGDHRSVSVDLRQVVHKAITVGADSVVFAHNHPSDCVTPSQQDIICLSYCEQALEPLGIKVADSYTVSRRGICSIKKIREQEERHARYLSDARDKEKRANVAKKRAATIARKKAEKKAA